MLNPFTNRGMITNPDYFFGREEQLNEIITRLRNMQSSSVVGERRIGKSSLLYHLKSTGAHRIDNSDYCFLYADLQDARFQTANGFLQNVLKMLDGEADAIKEKNSLNGNLVAFSEEIETLMRKNQQVVLCLDEFENTFKHREQFNEDFFDHMRSMLNQRKLAFVTSTRQTLQKLSLEGKLVSPFYNVFTVIELGEFTEEEARLFLIASHKRMNFTDDERKFILSAFEPHPLKLQIICDWVIKNREKRLDEEALAEEITKEYRNFFVGKFDAKNLLRTKKAFSLDNIKRWLDTLKSGRDVFKFSDKE